MSIKHDWEYDLRQTAKGSDPMSDLARTWKGDRKDEIAGTDVK